MSTRTAKTFTSTEFGSTHSYEAYTEDGGKTWRWVSNDAYCPVDACGRHSIPCDPVAQRVAVNKQNDTFLAEYRAQQANHKPSAEELYEMRAAFGPGVTVVNVITGRKTHL